ncbi:EF-hand domain-containing protein [Pontixanthobacter aquaemixtae]|uniref:EF-hand domain-containing protein n=1 Tax=Pontixanthobacter aquaemixtae TaxID=1958940 RepID=A0A844ZR42_9SPHN|nr:EF-hand domain-containing protein [Pontixanthobacter aquaemixtae]MXO90293.1 hypothetical protein [Pontixanthobacter aquaemixtae]
MNRILLGGVSALLLAGIGLFWWQGRAQVEEAAPPPDPAPTQAMPSEPEIPTSDVGDLRGPTPPEATELSREQRRFFRYDRNRDLRITRNEMLSTRTNAFRKLDKDGNNLLTFEEWAVATATRFDKADSNGDRELSAAEFATTRPKRRASRSSCRC